MCACTRPSRLVVDQERVCYNCSRNWTRDLPQEGSDALASMAARYHDAFPKAVESSVEVKRKVPASAVPKGPVEVSHEHVGQTRRRVQRIRFVWGCAKELFSSTPATTDS